MRSGAEEERRRILLVEDDTRIGESLRRALDSTGYDTVWATSARDAEKAFHGALVAQLSFELVLLDLGLPDADGLDVCRRLVAADPLVPVVILTARDEELDLVVGLDAGAIDYITKPFSLANVLARLRAQLRRTIAATTESHFRSSPGIGVTVNLQTRRVLRHGVEVTMRPKEFDLLARLIRSAGSVIRRETLMADVWDENWFGSTKTLDFHIAALRSKLDGNVPATDGGAASCITTIRGVGFRFEQ
jgi:DNA-binding response OmpR family regulator